MRKGGRGDFYRWIKLLFGSYARGEETPESDIDIIVFGGDGFKKTDIFAFAEELRIATGKDVDAFEICEVNSDFEFYRNAVCRNPVFPHAGISDPRGL